MGAAPITVSWVSMAVLLLVALAMLSAWPFAVNGWGTLTLNVALYGGLSAAPLVYRARGCVYSARHPALLSIDDLEQASVTRLRTSRSRGRKEA